MLRLRKKAAQLSFLHSPAHSKKKRLLSSAALPFISCGAIPFVFLISSINFFNQRQRKEVVDWLIGLVFIVAEQWLGHQPLTHNNSINHQSTLINPLLWPPRRKKDNLIDFPLGPSGGKIQIKFIFFSSRPVSTSPN